MNTLLLIIALGLILFGFYILTIADGDKLDAWMTGGADDMDDVWDSMESLGEKPEIVIDEDELATTKRRTNKTP